MSETKTALAYPRLCIAYFLQFAIWGSWGFALGGYAGNTLGFTGPQVGWLYSAIPLGAIISPLFIGPIADRYFSAQKVLAVLHLLSGICMLIGGMTSNFNILVVLMLLHGICYMPTIPLINSVVFKHMPNPDNAPRVFMFGTIGWIFINIFIASFCGGMATPGFFFVAATCSILLAVYALTLPDTPPSGAGEPSGDALGLGALSLLKNPTFLIFVLCAFLASIPACNYFFPALGKLLSQRGYPEPLALTTINQLAEIAFMAALPFFVAKFGLKRVLMIGMTAWAVRYLCFARPEFSLAMIGLILHGFCYSFLYVGAYMYGDKVAPAKYKASVQSLLTFLLLGVGQVLGAQWEGYAEQYNPPQIASVAYTTPDAAFANVDTAKGEVMQLFDAKSEEDVAKLNKAWGDLDLAILEAQNGLPTPGWANPKQSEAWKMLNLSGTVQELLGQSIPKVEIQDLSSEIDKDQDNVITYTELEAIPANGLEFGKITTTKNEDGEDDVKPNLKSYPRAAIIAAFQKVAGKDVAPADIKVTRDQWLAAKATNWTMVFLVPAVYLFVILALFAVVGKDPKDEDAVVEAPDADE